MNIDWFTFIAQIVNFAVLVFLLNHFLYGPITSAMKQREDTIAERLQLGNELQEQALAEGKRFKELSERLEHQRAELFDKARDESDAARNKLIAEARTDIQTRRHDWLQSLHREQGSLINLVRQRANQQVIGVSRKALAQLANVDLEDQVLTTFIKLVAQLPFEQIERLKDETAKGNRAEVHTAFDIATTWKERILKSFLEKGIEQLVFVTSPGLICGVELRAGGTKIGWSIREYLDSLNDELQGLLSKEER